jgi:uncharacterized protein (TIGR00369 family)
MTHEAKESLKPVTHDAQNRCFGCGPANTTGLRLEFFLAPDGSVVSFPNVAPAFDGHPGYLHGGIIATLLDEAMSKAVRALGKMAMTRKIEIEYLRPVPSGVVLRLEGRIVGNEERKHWIEARVLNERGTVLAQAQGLFVEIRARA